MRALLYYRALHELRRTLCWTGPLNQKIKSACFLLLLPSGSIVMLQIYKNLFAASWATNSSMAVFFAGMLLTGNLYYLFLAAELFREISFSPDLELLSISPLPAAAAIGNRVFFANLRLLPLHIAILLFPFSFVSFYPDTTVRRILFIICALACYVFVQTLALKTCVELAGISNRKHTPREAVSALIFIFSIVSGVAASYPLVDAKIWRQCLALFDGMEATSWALLISAALFIVVSRWLYEDSLRRWPAASRLPEIGKRAPRLLPGRNHPFAKSPALALFQKDLKDLVRNPAYKYASLCCISLLPLMLIAQWKAGSGGPPSWRRLMASLSLIYMVPLFLSARVMSLEYRMIGFYQLVLPRVERLLDLKWRAHALVDCLAVGALALPFFLLVHQGEKSFEAAYYAAAVIVYVPLLTMLAIALGTFFPSTTIPPNPIGIRSWGLAIYVLLSIVLYSFLLNYMYLGAALYSFFLAPLTIVLFFRARRHLRVL